MARDRAPAMTIMTHPRTPGMSGNLVPAQEAGGHFPDIPPFVGSCRLAGLLFCERNKQPNPPAVATSFAASRLLSCD